MDYTRQELMVAAAAREIHDGELVFVGMRLPLLAFSVAKRTHAPNSIGLFESGIMRAEPAPELLYTMCDLPNQAGALWCTRMVNLMGLLGQGRVDLGFIGGAEVDRFGNINTSYLGDPARPKVKLPGSGGAADIASLSHRLIAIMEHERRRFPERVDYVTSPGYGEGGDWRMRVGLPRGGTSAVITTLGVLRFDPPSREAYLGSYHPGATPDEIRQNTGWDLRVADDVHETPTPSSEELDLIRFYDPKGFWTR